MIFTCHMPLTVPRKSRPAITRNSAREDFALRDYRQLIIRLSMDINVEEPLSQAALALLYEPNQ
jgi:hypothetical protein